MTIFGLNSPEIFVVLLIILIILGTKRIELGLKLFSRLLIFLLNNQSNINKTDQKKELIKEIEETKAKGEESEKNEKKTTTKEKELIKEIEETQAKGEESEKKLKIVNVENKEKKSTTTKDPKGIKKDKTVNKLKTKVPKGLLKEKTARKSKIINGQDEQLDK